MEIRTPENEKEWEAYYDLRYRILREPLGQERGSERNEGDLTGIHFALYDSGFLRGIARLDHVDSSVCQVRFVAVDTTLQGRGYGRKIMEAAEERARREGYQKLVLHARDNALDFYKKLHYTLLRPSHKLFGVLQHFEMEKQL